MARRILPVDMGRPKKPEPVSRFPLPRSVDRRLRRLAAHAERDPDEYAAELLRPLLDKEEAKMLADIARERKEAEGK